jgi:cytochrome P450
MTDSAYDYRTSSIGRALRYSPAPQETYRELAEQRLVRKDGAVNVFSYDDIVTINKDPHVLGTGGAGVQYMGSARPRIPQDYDGAEHLKWRKVLNPLFTPRAMGVLTEDIVRVCHELIDSFVDEGEVELFSQFCTPLPVRIFLSLMGVPADNMDLFLAFKDGVLHPVGETPEELTAYSTEAGRPLNEYLAQHLEERRTHGQPGPDLIAALMEVEIEGAPLTDEELIDIVYELLLAGLDSVSSSLSTMIVWLAEHPETRQELVDDPDKWPGAVEELLRYETPIPAQPRFAVRDIDLGGGEVIQAGEAVQILVAAANMDSSKFDDPMDVQIDRRRNAHLAFSIGAHRCLGIHLARLELRVVLTEFHRRIPHYRLRPGDEPTFDNMVIRAARHIPLLLGTGESG